MRANPSAGKGIAVGRRGIKEYRAPEALILIALDRDRKPLVCPSCDSTDITRIPGRDDDDQAGRITLRCNNCGRCAVYLQRGSGPVVTPEEPKRG
ncbi:MAG TPA: hypothetical protein VFL88_13330 [Gemmatimonadales bacterium]|nr:hypothetical protein [Gemmatimonadales bacterium]